MTKQDPPNWGEDSLSEFIKVAYENSFASFVKLKPQYKRLKGIDRMYRVLVDNLHNTQEWFAGFFVLRTHSSFLGGARLTLSGQIAEAFMVMRGCLENALYGLYLSRHPDSRETWLRRHENEEVYKKVRNEFRIRRLLDFLEEVDIDIYQVTNTLYERTIDFGAHPNERALSSSLRITEEQQSVRFDLNYLTGNSTELHHALKTNAQVGVCALEILRNVYTERYNILGITDTLQTLKNGL